MSKAISPSMVQRETYKFYLGPALWLVYLIGIAYCFQNIPVFISLILMVFPGSFLFCWIIAINHDTFHKYLKHLPNRALYNFGSRIIFTDPQIFRIVHKTHHINTHTWQDIEFHPFGYIKNPFWRRLFTLCEITLGSTFLFTATGLALDLRKHPQYSKVKALINGPIVLLILSPIIALCYFILHVSLINLACAWLLSLLIAGIVLHSAQIFEHGGIIAEDKNIKQRIQLTRNLRGNDLVTKFFLFVTKWNSYQHLLHHDKVHIYSRPFPNHLPMPEGAVYVGLKDYWKIIKVMLTH